MTERGEQQRIGEEFDRVENSHDPFASAVRTTRMPMVITDPHRDDNSIVFANDAFVRLTGYAREEILGRNCRFLQGPQTNMAETARLRQAIRDRKPIELDLLNYRKDGSTFWNRLVVAPVFDRDGGLIHFFASQLNITSERERLRDLGTAVGRSEQVLDALIRSSSEVRFQVSADWSNLRQLTGGSFLADTAADNPNWVESYIPSQDHTAVRAEIDRAISTKSTYRSEHRVYRADGTIGWALSRAVPLLDAQGDIIEWYGTASDITERRRAEDALRENETRLRLAIEAGQIGEWELDLRTNTSVRALRHDQIFGHDEPVRDWGIDTFLGHVLPEDRAGVETAFARSAETGVGWNFQCRIRRSNDGQVRWIMARSASQRDNAGHPIKLFGMVQDITGQKAAEDGLRDLNDTLEHRVAETLAQRAQVEDQLRQSQKLEAVGQLTGGVAHDFNNLLTVIPSSIDLLKRPNLTEERHTRYIGAISDTVDRAAKLTGQLLAFARQQTLQPVVFAACASVRALSDMMATLTGSRIKLEMRLPSHFCYVLADPSQFDTALVNLAVNARNAMNGAGKLIITVEPVEAIPAVRSHPARTGTFMAASVTDTGSGIPPHQLQQVFEPFFTTKETGKGTGLGLSQVLGFAKQSGGDVAVVSTPGEGTTFTVYLPRVPGDGRPLEEVQDSEPLRAGHGTCVLVVEDNADVGSFAQQSLNDLGYVVVLAPSAEDALAELDKNAGRFDVVFSDVVMPGMSGIELGQEIRRRYHDLPVLLASGYSHVLAQNGTFGFELLHKPYSVDHLSRLLRKVARWRQRERS